jgi:lysylphosphatidylglycerol synthetase-like protein (DUF2156 family)
MQRPTGVTLSAAFYGILGVFGVIFGLLAMAGGAALGGLSGSGILAGVAGAFGFLLLLFGVLCLVVAWGLWVLRSWAWTAGLVLSAVLGVLSLLQLVSAFSIGTLVLLIIYAAIAWYLWQPAARAVFGRARAA